MQFRKLETREAVSEHVSALNASRAWVVLDTETTGLDFRRDRILDVQLSGVEPGSAVLFNADFINELAGLKGDMLLVGHNLAFDLKMLHSAGADFTGYRWRDTMLMHHLLDEEAAHGLGEIVESLWGDPFKREFWAKYKKYEDASEEDKLQYSCRDIYYTEKLYRYLCQSLVLGGL